MNVEIDHFGQTGAEVLAYISYLANLNLSVMIEHFPSDKVLHTPPPQYRGTSDDLSSTARTRTDKKTVPLESRQAPTSSSTGATAPIFYFHST